MRLNESSTSKSINKPKYDWSFAMECTRKYRKHPWGSSFVTCAKPYKRKTKNPLSTGFFSRPPHELRAVALRLACGRHRKTPQWMIYSLPQRKRFPLSLSLSTTTSYSWSLSWVFTSQFSTQFECFRLFYLLGCR